MALVRNGTHSIEEAAKHLDDAHLEIFGKNWKGVDDLKYADELFATAKKKIYNGIKHAPEYPKGFKARLRNHTTRNKVTNKKLLRELRELEPGAWKKVYKDGFDARGKQISIHYFESRSGKVFGVKIKNKWSN